MLRVVNTCEKNIVSDKIQAVPIPANQATDTLKSIRGNAGGINQEYAARYIQNIGANPCFYALDIDCDGVLQVNGLLQSGQQFDASNWPGRVSVFSAAGTTIAITQLRRADVTTHANMATGKMNIG